MATGSEPGANSVAHTMDVARKSIHTALDCQTFIMSLLAKGSGGGVQQQQQQQHRASIMECALRFFFLDHGSAGLRQLCRHLPLLEAPLTREIKSMIAVEDNELCARSVRDFKSKMDATTLAYEPLAERLIQAAASRGDGGDGSSSSKLSNVALRDAAKAEMHANTLYSWARTFIPKLTSSSSGGGGGTISKGAKLHMLPYLVAMAYAVRVKLDVFYVEGSVVNKAERLEYWERSRTVVEQFVSVLQGAVRVTLGDSSLLDVAIDYHLALTTYIVLMATLRKSVQMMLAPHDAPKAIQLWDDGLAELRWAGRRAWL